MSGIGSSSGAGGEAAVGSSSSSLRRMALNVNFASEIDVDDLIEERHQQKQKKKLSAEKREEAEEEKKKLLATNNNKHPSDASLTVPSGDDSSEEIGLVTTVAISNDNEEGKMAAALDQDCENPPSPSPPHGRPDAKEQPIKKPPPSNNNNNKPSAVFACKQMMKKLIKEQWHWRHVKIVQIVCVIFIVIKTFGGYQGGNAQDGWIVDPNNPENTANGIVVNPDDGSERSIVCTTTFQLICLVVARITAFYMYPTLILVYVSKLRATTNFMAQTPLSMFGVCDDWHDLHIYCGWSILVNSILHTIFHLIRYADQGNLELLVTNRTGLSGCIILLSLLLICLPMMVTSLKQRIKYEIRKGILHYFFYIFGVALAFHSPASAWPNGGWAPYVFGILISWYALDSLYCYTYLTEMIDTTVFHVLSSGVQMTMKVSDRYTKNTSFMGGYCYICLPWVDKTQWHAFSLFEHPTNPNLKQVFMLNNGDWTNEVHNKLQRNTVRPIWIQGPYLSPYNKSVNYDNQIMIASGIGITPALSVIRSQKDTRRTNLIWCVRDPALLEFFLEHAYLDHSGWNLFYYTGKQPLLSSRIDSLTSTNVQVIHGRRPDLPKVIRNIIYGIESQKGCPKQYVQDQKMQVIDAILDALQDLENQEGSKNLSPMEKFDILADTAMVHGFQLSNAVDGLFVDDDGEEEVAASPFHDKEEEAAAKEIDNDDEEEDADEEAQLLGPSNHSRATTVTETQIMEKLSEMVFERSVTGDTSWHRERRSTMMMGQELDEEGDTNAISAGRFSNKPTQPQRSISGPGRWGSKPTKRLPKRSISGPGRMLNRSSEMARQQFGGGRMISDNRRFDVTTTRNAFGNRMSFLSSNDGSSLFGGGSSTFGGGGSSQFGGGGSSHFGVQPSPLPPSLDSSGRSDLSDSDISASDAGKMSIDRSNGSSESSGRRNPSNNNNRRTNKHNWRLSSRPSAMTFASRGTSWESWLSGDQETKRRISGMTIEEEKSGELKLWEEDSGDEEHHEEMSPPEEEAKSLLPQHTSERRSDVRAQPQQRQRDTLVKSVKSSLQVGYQPWQDDWNDEAEEFVTNIMSEDELATWGLMYCGGSKVIENKLKLASERYNIQLHSENFSW